MPKPNGSQKAEAAPQNIITISYQIFYIWQVISLYSYSFAPSRIYWINTALQLQAPLWRKSPSHPHFPAYELYNFSVSQFPHLEKLGSQLIVIYFTGLS